ncbi:MAG: AAA family ATPase [Chloroflexi bacterium]|nr:AAA family ATPase [Chloroflexota bacterium]
MARGSSPAIRVFLLGRFEIACGERTMRDSDWTRRKAAVLFQRVAIERRLTKDQAIDFLWRDADSAAGANNLYRTLHALRQTLDRTLGAGSADATLTFEDGVLGLSDSTWVDVHQFEQLTAASPTDSSTQRIEKLEQALTLYAGDLLPNDLYSDWIQTPRDTLRRLYRETVLALVTHFRATRDSARVIALLTQLLARDPADEFAHRELMRAYALAGRRHEALRQYQLCLDALAKELDVPPEPETSALYSQILSGELTPILVQPIVLPTFITAEVEQSVPLVGRETELETLRTRIHTPRRESGQTLLLAGDAGIGKTRLALEILRAGATLGMATLIGAAYEQEGQIAFQPFIEAFDRYLAEHQRPTNENPITHYKRGGSSDPQQEQWALFNSIVAFLMGLSTAPDSKSTHVIFLIDDLHAADEASLRLFHYLARQTRTAPILLLATYRSESVATASSFRSLLNTLYRERLSETISLSPLTQQATAHILQAIFGGKVSAQVVATVYDIGEGNPFYVQEIARALIKTEQVEQQGTEWRLRNADTSRPIQIPEDLSGLLRERVARLGTHVEMILSAAAVLGREFDYESLHGMTALGDATVLDALDATLAAHLLEETESGYRFRHALIRRTLYDSLSRVRRAQLHTRAAEAIEAIQARRPHDATAHVEALAYHYDSSDRRDRALDYLIRAGQKAANLFAFEVAADYFERALALLDALGLADAARRWMVLESLGWWYNILADTPRAVTRFEQALALKSSAGWESQPRDRVRLRCGAAVALITTGNLAQADAHLRIALAEVDEREDAPEYADLLYNIALFHWHQGEYREAYQAAEKSLNVADRIDKPDAVARAFEMLALACHSLGEWQTGIYYEQQRATLVGPDLDVTDAFDTHL